MSEDHKHRVVGVTLSDVMFQMRLAVSAMRRIVSVPNEASRRAKINHA